MEIKISTDQILNFLKVIAWIIFIGLCIEAGSILFHTLFTVLKNPEATKIYWKVVDLSSLLNFDKGHYLTTCILMFIPAVMKALLSYLIVKLLHEKKLNLAQPFNIELKSFMNSMGYLALGIALFSNWGAKNSKWLVTQGVQMPDIQSLNFGGADVWFFMGIIFLIIAQIFKRGIEIQSENDLTI